MKTKGHFRADLEKYYRIEFRGKTPSLWRKAKLWATHLGLHCVVVYRLSRYCRARLRRGRFWIIPLFILAEILGFLVKFFHHVDIFAADIGPGFYIGHLGTIYIGRTRIGENFSVTHNLTIGTGISDGSQSLPTLGRDVWIGTGCVLYGKIHIGNGVTVNAGTVLSRSIPDGCLVSGNPGRILMHNYNNSMLFGIARATAAVPVEGRLPAATAAPAAEPAAPIEDPIPNPSAMPETRKESLRQ